MQVLRAGDRGPRGEIERREKSRNEAGKFRLSSVPQLGPVHELGGPGGEQVFYHAYCLRCSGKRICFFPFFFFSLFFFWFPFFSELFRRAEKLSHVSHSRPYLSFCTLRSLFSFSLFSLFSCSAHVHHLMGSLRRLWQASALQQARPSARLHDDDQTRLSRPVCSA